MILRQCIKFNMTEPELFERIFKHTPPQGIKRYVPPTYDIWLELLNENEFLHCLWEPRKLERQWHYIENNKKHFDLQYANYIKSTNLNFFRAFQCNNIQPRLQHIISCMIDIYASEVFSPPTVDMDLLWPPTLEIHPGQNMTSAHNILNKKMPVLFLKYKKKHIKNHNDIIESYNSIKNDYTVISKIKSLHDLTSIYNGDKIWGFIVNKGNDQIGKYKLHMFSSGRVGKRTFDGWPEQMPIDMEKFWFYVMEETNKHIGEKINFVYNKSNHNYSLYKLGEYGGNKKDIKVNMTIPTDMSIHDLIIKRICDKMYEN